jgi:hypothetical protein
MVEYTHVCDLCRAGLEYLTFFYAILPAGGYSGEICSSVAGTWAGHVTTTYDPSLICMVSALTGGDNCNSYCQAMGRPCIKAMDNVNSDNGAAKADGSCEVGGGTPSCDGGQTEEECAQGAPKGWTRVTLVTVADPCGSCIGCAQNWVGQICGCGPAACADLDVPAGDTICAAITGDWHSTIDKSWYDPNKVRQISHPRTWCVQYQGRQSDARACTHLWSGLRDWRGE